mmetsp:Transcript_57647/g.123992  ORF Transcript_57647/g.123992 Transcript_57647/m.123992 type:complete len:231 (+) Transcript_57647:564-1256(+)
MDLGAYRRGLQPLDKVPTKGRRIGGERKVEVIGAHARDIRIIGGVREEIGVDHLVKYLKSAGIISLLQTQLDACLVCGELLPFRLIDHPQIPEHVSEAMKLLGGLQGPISNGYTLQVDTLCGWHELVPCVHGERTCRHILASIGLPSDVEVVRAQCWEHLEELRDRIIKVAADFCHVLHEAGWGLGEAESSSDRVVQEQEVVMFVPSHCPGLDYATCADPKGADLREHPE